MATFLLSAGVTGWWLSAPRLTPFMGKEVTFDGSAVEIANAPGERFVALQVPRDGEMELGCGPGLLSSYRYLGLSELVTFARGSKRTRRIANLVVLSDEKARKIRITWSPGYAENRR